MHSSGGQQSSFSTLLDPSWRCVQLHGEPPLLGEVRQRLEACNTSRRCLGHGLKTFEPYCRKLAIDTVWHAVTWQVTAQVQNYTLTANICYGELHSGPACVPTLVAMQSLSWRELKPAGHEHACSLIYCRSQHTHSFALTVGLPLQHSLVH